MPHVTFSRAINCVWYLFYLSCNSLCWFRYTKIFLHLFYFTRKKSVQNDKRIQIHYIYIPFLFSQWITFWQHSYINGNEQYEHAFLSCLQEYCSFSIFEYFIREMVCCWLLWIFVFLYHQKIYWKSYDFSIVKFITKLYDRHEKRIVVKQDCAKVKKWFIYDVWHSNRFGNGKYFIVLRLVIHWLPVIMNWIRFPNNVCVTFSKSH